MSIAASQYAAPRHKRDGDYLGTATIEVRLEQRGQCEPVIVVGLRAGGALQQDDAGLRTGYHEVLRLGLTDGEELTAVIRHLVGRAEG